MKIALVIADDREQIVLTPETAAEKALVNLLGLETRNLRMHRGSFYNCQGGYYRQGAGDESVILVFGGPSA